MDFTEEHYYKLNRIIMVCLGLWPYNTSAFRKIQIIFYEALLISFSLCQLNVFLMKDCSIAATMRICMFLFCNLFFIIKYTGGLLLTDSFKYIFSRLRYDWNILKNQTEFEIIQKHADKTRFYTIIFMLIATSVVLGVISLAFASTILDIIIPLNESRPLRLPIEVEYFVDQQRYFYAISLHMGMTFYAGMMIMTAITTIFIAYVSHNCAIFEIVSYRLEHMFDEKILEMSKDIREHILHERLIDAVHLHCRAVDMTNVLTDNFATLFFILIVTGVACTTFSVFHIFYLMTLLNEIAIIDLISGVGCVLFQFYALFTGNYIGQDLIDISANVFQASYNMEWYAAPLWLQKLILFIMQKSIIHATLKAGGLFEGSLEGFARLISMTTSYVMFIHST
ncbi:hypothetical protein DMN91_009714 [Ooceraea biroi]|uniref:Odorant receptor n=1 Tax=Ooceraea biroi TaxID=2015173 RepID=A0A026VSL8_OOCBI|nr:uncharacterized protein LOC105287138 isoform X2 [Ooceraea biroi]EZA46768.1 hypothetical protein X777_02038 [Ooceraea biroi]RLU17479.1 hypothetical protein DMN91_009714 [Ooceraea biroi]